MIRVVRTRAVVFDLDGTLIDSMPLVLAAVGHALAPFGPRPAGEILASLGGPPERFLGTLLDDVRNVPVAVERLDDFHRENVHLIRAFEGVDQVLAGLRGAGIQAAIWTGRDRESAEWLIDRHELGGFFATTVCGDDLSSHKPDPEGLHEIMRRLDVHPAETLLVGDADVDVLGGAGCGVDTLLIGHAREVDRQIVAKSWRTVLTPEEAFKLVMESVRPVG